MGNRAVITTEDNFNNNGVGVYVHWNGGRDSVRAFLTYCKMRNFRAPEIDHYGWARLTQVIANFFEGGLCVGVDTVNNLDCNNYDNGVYIIKGWNIVDRKFHKGDEQMEYDLKEMLVYIDDRMPEADRFGEEYITNHLKECEVK